MTPLARAAAAVIALLSTATASPAQQPSMPAEPATPPFVQLGPVTVRPALVLRDVGYDSNVMNESGEARGDFTATLGGRADFGIRAGRVVGVSSASYDYLYFETFESERGSNRAADARVDLMLGRLRPFLTAALARSHERPNAEIDARALRRRSDLGGGLSWAALSRTSLFATYRYSTTAFAADEEFMGVSLATELNGRTGVASAGIETALTPLTTITVLAERSQDRFDSAGYRDADSFRSSVTATFHPLALISGRASVGVRAFRPIGGGMRDFTGVTADVAVGYAFRDLTRFEVTFDRDLRYSFIEQTPYYLSTGARVTVTHHLFGSVEGQARGGLERLAYESRIGAAGVDDRFDDIRTVGGGVGYRLGDGSRLGLNIDHTSRASSDDGREYERVRIYATLTYGF